ncbi:MAG TPA: hypothetical protein VMD91_17930 [Candidatus Sulfotelmatobacter sp.]|nr:hypothetical protein [Candidatus Sulfotelmatobacter sp.]
MTHGEEVVARWRCGSCANTHGALILLLHGEGSDEDELFDLVVLLPAEPAIAALRGFTPDGAGYGWFAADADGRPDPASLDTAVARVERWLDEQAGDAEEIWLAGVGQGATLVDALLRRAPQRYAGAALLESPARDGRVALDGLDVYRGRRPHTTGELRDLVDWFSARTTPPTLTITGEHR